MIFSRFAVVLYRSLQTGPSVVTVHKVNRMRVFFDSLIRFGVEFNLYRIPILTQWVIFFFPAVRRRVFSLRFAMNFIEDVFVILFFSDWLFNWLVYFHIFCRLCTVINRTAAMFWETIDFVPLHFVVVNSQESLHVPDYSRLLSLPAEFIVPLHIHHSSCDLIR